MVPGDPAVADRDRAVRLMLEALAILDSIDTAAAATLAMAINHLGVEAPAFRIDDTLQSDAATR